MQKSLSDKQKAILGVLLQQRILHYGPYMINKTLSYIRFKPCFQSDEVTFEVAEKNGIDFNNIVLQRHSCLEPNLKENLESDVFVCRFFDPVNNTVFYAFGPAMREDDLTSILDSLCEYGDVMHVCENDSDNKTIKKQVGITVKDCKVYYVKQKFSDFGDLDADANKIYYVGFSQGGKQALEAFYFDAKKYGSSYSSKCECITINGMSLSQNSYEYIKNLFTEDEFNNLSEKILNVNAVNDTVSPMAQVSLGRTIYFKNCENASFDGHWISDIDLEHETLRGWKYYFYHCCYKSILNYINDNRAIAHKRIKSLFSWFDNDGNQYGRWDIFVCLCVLIRAGFVGFFVGTYQWAKNKIRERYLQQKNDNGLVNSNIETESNVDIVHEVKEIEVPMLNGLQEKTEK